MLLSSENFRRCLQTKFEQDFDHVTIDPDMQELLGKIASHIDVDVYVKLLSLIDLWDFENFQRYLFVSIRMYYDNDYRVTDIENIKDHKLLQIFCIVCLQHYFL